jgi:hypothetical protein
MSFNPSTYEQWLSEIKFSNEIEDIIKAAKEASKYKADKNELRHDVALVLADKYRTEIKLAGGRSMLIRTIRDKFEKITQILFKSNLGGMLNYVIKNEPNFDIGATKKAQGMTPLGFIDAGKTVDSKGRVRTPLGYISPPGGRVNEEGDKEPGLGFL